MGKLISFLICYRTEERSDHGCSLFTNLKKFNDALKPEDRSKIEILIRTDNDDRLAHNRLNDAKFINSLGFPIRVFKHNRWEGRFTFNYHYMYLFSQRNPESKFIGFMTDDCLFTEKCGNMIQELEERYLNKDYVVLHSSPIQQDTYPPTWPLDLNMKERLKEIIELGDYKTLEVTKRWCTSFLTESYPIVSSKLIEVIGNLGWQVNIDSTLALLNIILYQKYGLNIHFVLDTKHFIRMDSVRIDKENIPKYPFNHDMTLNASKTSSNQYLYKLMEQQAKNIYLNMKEDGVLKEYGT